MGSSDSAGRTAWKSRRKWRRGAMDRQRPPGAVRSRRRSQRAASATAADELRRLLPRRPHPSRSRQGDPASRSVAQWPSRRSRGRRSATVVGCTRRYACARRGVARHSTSTGSDPARYRRTQTDMGPLAARRRPQPQCQSLQACRVPLQPGELSPRDRLASRRVRRDPTCIVRRFFPRRLERSKFGERTRIPRWGGVEAAPKTGPRDVDCSYDPEIFAAFERRRRAALTTGRRTTVSVMARDTRCPKTGSTSGSGSRPSGARGSPHGVSTTPETPSSRCHCRPARTPAGWPMIRGTSERMIFQHYRKWMSGLVRDDGRRVATLFRNPAARRRSSDWAPDGHQQAHRGRKSSKPRR